MFKKGALEIILPCEAPKAPKYCKLLKTRIWKTWGERERAE